MKNAEQIIAESIDYLVAHYQERPDLTFLAHRAGYDTAHFQKLFKAHVGISPKRLCQYMSASHARSLLAEGTPTLDAALETGLSGNGRLHDLLMNVEGVTPGAIQKRGAGLHIRYGFQPSPLGELMIARTDKGLCWLGFQVDESRVRSCEKMRAHWPLADFIHEDEAVAGAAQAISKIWGGDFSGSPRLGLDLYGTNFQIQVWQALLKIPFGKTLTYKEVAEHVGRPGSSRAVGNAVGANPVSLLIPCHRVIRATGIIDNYGWGSPRKKLLLAVEGTL